MNFGGNVLVWGLKDGKPYKIGIRDPFSGPENYVAVIEGTDISVVTSGGYERFYDVDGKRYHHIIDPKTGYPVHNELASVTVVHEKSIYADALSTSFFVLGLEKGLELANELEERMYILLQTTSIYCSKGAERRITLIDSKYSIIPVFGE